mgnify:CR=1 FL=1
MRSTCGECDGPVRYQHGPGTTLTVLGPAECRHGHQLRPNKVTVGYRPGLPSHATYYCWACHDEGREDPMMAFEFEE